MRLHVIVAVVICALVCANVVGADEREQRVSPYMQRESIGPSLI